MFEIKLLQNQAFLISNFLLIASKFDESDSKYDKKMETQNAELNKRIKEEADKLNQHISEKILATRKLIADQRLELYEVINDQLNKAEQQLKEEKAKIYKELDVNREEATFTFEFENINAFLDSDHKEKRASEYFFCRSIKWYIGLLRTVNEEDGESYLSIRLYAHNPSDSYTGWSIATKFGFKLLVGEKEELDLNPKYEEKTATSEDPFGGYTRSLKIAHLKKEKYLENDRIRLQVHLIAKPLQRQGPLTEEPKN